MLGGTPCTGGDSSPLLPVVLMSTSALERPRISLGSTNHHLGDYFRCSRINSQQVKILSAKRSAMNRLPFYIMYREDPFLTGAESLLSTIWAMKVTV